MTNTTNSTRKHVNIVITLFEIESLPLLLTWIDENLNPLSMTIGRHKDAKREHFHVALYMIERPTVKDLSKYYRVTKRAKDLLDDPRDIKFSIYEEDDKKFDMRNCLAYPLKEYESYDELEFTGYIRGISEKYTEDLRAYANSIYKAKKYREKRELQKREENNDNQVKLQQYLDQRFNQELMDEVDDGTGFTNWTLKPTYHADIFETYMTISTWIHEWHINQDKFTWRWQDVPNQVLSYMARHQYWDIRKLIQFKEGRK